jgi:hypothetical protein
MADETLVPKHEEPKVDFKPDAEARRPLRQVAILAPGVMAYVNYTNWQGRKAIRHILFDGAPFWGLTDWHPVPCWLISGTDLEKGEHRLWSIAHMSPV